MDNFNEAEIQSNETERVQREENRINNETERINSEAERVANEIQRVAREDIRQGFYDGFNSQMEQNTKHIYGYVNIKEFEEFVVDDDWGLAFNEALKKYNTIIVGDGTYTIKTPILLVSDKTIKGNGSSTILKSEVAEGEFTLKALNPIQRLTLKHFKILSDYNLKRGGVRVNGTTRGITVDNIWMEKVAYGLKCAGNMWGKSTFSNIHCLYLNSASTDDTYGISVTGNTMFFDKIDIIGNYKYGFYADTGRVFSLMNFNIAGSTDTYQMDTALYFKNIHQGVLSCGWIECLSTKVKPVGEQNALIFNNSTFDVASVDCAVGSIYCDKGKYSFRNIYLGNNTSSIRCTNRPKIVIENLQHTNTGYINAYSSTMLSDADYFFINNNYEILNNEKIYGSVNKTNSSLVTIEDETLDTLSSSNAKKIITKDYQGARLRFTNLIPGALYTFVCCVKKTDNINYINLKQVSGYSFVTGLVSSATYSDEWVKLNSYITSDSNGSISVDVVCKSIDSSIDSVFLIDNYFLVKKVNPNLI